MTTEIINEVLEENVSDSIVEKVKKIVPESEGANDVAGEMEDIVHVVMSIEADHS